MNEPIIIDSQEKLLEHFGKPFEQTQIKERPRSYCVLCGRDLYNYDCVCFDCGEKMYDIESKECQIKPKLKIYRSIEEPFEVSKCE